MTTLATGTVAAAWPDVVRVPRASARAAAARVLFRAAVNRLPLRVQLPRATWGAGTAGAPTMRVLRPDDVFARLGSSGLIGLGESYLAGEWDAGATLAGGRDDRLVDLLTVFADDLPRLVPAPLQTLRRIAVRRRPHSERNTPQAARTNVAAHYDLSNDLFATFLDASMTYSAALFEHPDEDLLTAQHRKIDRLLDATGVGPGTRLLEIGTGWGELALRAAARGARVVTITLSAEQRDLAARRVADAGLAERVEVRLCDYREAAERFGAFDAVVSVEMIEAVGAEYWPAYFATLERVLAPGGTIGLQAITMPHERMLASRDTWTWIQKYVFPGGLIPSVEAVHEHAAGAGLAVVDDLAFGAGYAQTLRRWRHRFAEREDDVARLGFDGTFRRMWDFYLAYSEAGFRSGYLDVHQFVLRRQG